MLTENQAKWMFDKLLVLFRMPPEQVQQEAERIRRLSRNDGMVQAMTDIVLEEIQPCREREILRDYHQLVMDNMTPEDSNEWWLEMYGRVNRFRQKYNYNSYVQELADAFCRELRRKDTDVVCSADSEGSRK